MCFDFSSNCPICVCSKNTNVNFQLRKKLRICEKLCCLCLGNKNWVEWQYNSSITTRFSIKCLTKNKLMCSFYDLWEPMSVDCVQWMNYCTVLHMFRAVCIDNYFFLWLRQHWYECMVCAVITNWSCKWCFVTYVCLEQMWYENSAQILSSHQKSFYWFCLFPCHLIFFLCIETKKIFIWLIYKYHTTHENRYSFFMPGNKNIEFTWIQMW